MPFLFKGGAFYGNCVVNSGGVVNMFGEGDCIVSVCGARLRYSVPYIYIYIV